MNKHNGQITEYVVRKNGYNISELARSLSINRRSCYNWFQQADLGPANIRKIGNVIRHDFSKEFPEFFTADDFPVFEPKTAYAFYTTTPVADDQINWEQKYANLLAEYNNYLRAMELPATRK